MTGNGDGERIGGAGAGNGANGLRRADPLSDLAIGRRFAMWNLA